MFYSLCCICLCVPSFGIFPMVPISRPIPDFYAEILAFYVDILCYLELYAWYRAWYGGDPVCIGGVCSLVRGVNRSYSK